MKTLPLFTFGMGDRFGHQGEAQLIAVMDARKLGIDVAPVWNKSKREHTLIGTEPQSLRDEADAAVAVLGYEEDYFVDADHINLQTVDDFLACSDFFTLDVAEELGKAPVSSTKAAAYSAALSKLGSVELRGIDGAFTFDASTVESMVSQYGGAVEAAKRLFDKIMGAKDADSFAIEVSMDETDTPQGPRELLAILCMLSVERIPVQTIAPKFSGRFNKGVDYVGDPEQFRSEFEADLIVLKYAVETLGLPESLNLSVHSGRDKFSLYPIIRDLIEKHQAGLHMKTAGTTWLEEVIGLAESGGDALSFVKRLYIGALDKVDALTAPYATVLDIDRSKLPTAEEAENWTSQDVIDQVSHDLDNPKFNSSLRQFLHVSFKLAAQTGDQFLDLLKANAEIVNKRVYDNLYHKHILQVFPSLVRS